MADAAAAAAREGAPSTGALRRAPTRPPLTGPTGQRAFRVGRLFGIDVGLDLSWLLIFGLVTFALVSRMTAEHPEWGPAATWSASLAASLLFFLGILAHELGHSITSNLLGLPVRSITLFVFGGVAQLSGRPRRPRDAFLIGAAGPAVSVLLGGAFLIAAALLPDAPRALEVAGVVAAWLGMVNLVLAAFNLFPGTPLDGGHLLRAAVWAASGDEHLGTRVASFVGSAFALFLVGLGLFMVLGAGALGGLWLVLIGWFLFRSARRAVVGEVLEDRLRAVRVEEALAEPGPRVSGGESVARLVEEGVLRRGQRTFVVEEAGELAGVVGLQELEAVPAAHRADTSVASVMVPRAELPELAADESLWTALRRMDEEGAARLVVTRDGGALGVLTRGQLQRVVRNQLDLGGGR